jgi:hypothetical protein
LNDHSVARHLSIGEIVMSQRKSFEAGVMFPDNDAAERAAAAFAMFGFSFTRIPTFPAAEPCVFGWLTGVIKLDDVDVLDDAGVLGDRLKAVVMPFGEVLEWAFANS